MAKKKKKMTKAQAAAARRDDSRAKKTYATPVPTKGEGPKDKNSLFTIVVPLVSIGVIVLFSIIFSVGPGLLVGR